MPAKRKGNACLSAWRTAIKKSRAKYGGSSRSLVGRKGSKVYKYAKSLMNKSKSCRKYRKSHSRRH